MKAGTEFALNPAVERIVDLRLDDSYMQAVEQAECLLAGSLSLEERRYVLGELAHLRYYQGDFTGALHLIATAPSGSQGVAAARLKLAESVNLLALNEGNGAYSAAVDAVLQLRIAGEPVRDMVAALVQLTHVEANRGRPGEARGYAHEAMAWARSSKVSRQERARAEYVVGYAKMCAGDATAVEHFLKALSDLGDRSPSLRHWLTFCLATHFRDQGWSSAAGVMLGQSVVHVRHERAWFAVRSGDLRSAASCIRSPRFDERPYARTVLAAIRLMRNRNQGRGLQRAITGFQHGGLDHWRWGAQWLLAGATVDQALRRRTILVLIEELRHRQALHWGFYDPNLAFKLTTSVAGRGPHDSFTRDLLERLRTTGDPSRAAQTPIRALSVLTPSGLAVLLRAGVTRAETDTLIAAVQEWLDRPVSRAELARRLGLSEATVRAQLHELRSKLDITGSRGVSCLVVWLAERELLSASVLARAIVRLAGRDHPNFSA